MDPGPAPPWRQVSPAPCHHYRPVADKHIVPAGMVGLPAAADVLRLSEMSYNQSTFV